MSTVIRYPDAQHPPLEEWMDECKLNVYDHPLSKTPSERRWSWNVLVPPDWDLVPGQRAHISTDSDRQWYSGTTDEEETARMTAAELFGQVLGLRLGRWLGPQEVPTSIIPPIHRLGD